MLESFWNHEACNPHICNIFHSIGSRQWEINSLAGFEPGDPLHSRHVLYQGVPGSDPGGIWNFFCFVPLDIPYFIINFLPAN